jgi:Spy/CpxP family protein refolding chaperone
VAVAVWSLALVALAGPRGGHPAMMKKALKDKVGLSDAQIDQIQKLQYQADRDKLDIEHEMRKARLDLEQAMQAERPDRAKIFGQLDKLGQIETQMKKNRVGLMLEIRKLVSPEQWQKMEELHAEHKMQRRARRMQNRRAGPDAPGLPSAPDVPADETD